MTTNTDWKKQLAAFDRLARAYNISRNTRDACRWTAEEWLVLLDMYDASGWDITPCQWTSWQVLEALEWRLPPKWDENENPVLYTPEERTAAIKKRIVDATLEKR